MAGISGHENEYDVYDGSCIPLTFFYTTDLSKPDYITVGSLTDKMRD